MAKPKKEHTDILGQPVELGSYIAVAHRNQLKVCKVMKLNNAMIRVWPIASPISKYVEGAGWLVYSEQCVVLSGESALAYILKH